MTKIDTVVIGASAGGVEALRRLVADLPLDLPAALFVVMHFPQSSTSALPHILARSGPLPAVHAEDGEEPREAHIYVAAPGRHMLLESDRIKLVAGPTENRNRPAIDPLFRTAAHNRGNRVVAVLLSGLLDDGAVGLAAVRKAGGVAIAQDPADALFGDMPANGIRFAGADYILKIDEIASKIIELAGTEAKEFVAYDPPDPVEMTISELPGLELRGKPSEFVCPDCGGTLYELHANGLLQFRCRVGHSFLPESLDASQSAALEGALWAALRLSVEHNDFLHRLLCRAEDEGLEATTSRYRARLAEGERRIGVLRAVLGVDRLH